MKRLTALATAAAAMCIAAPAHTQGASSSMCPEIADSPRARACLRTEVTEAERGLAVSWREVFAFFGASHNASGAALLAEQRAWIAFKDKACGLYFQRGLSSLEWSNGMRCRVRLIHNRVVELDRLKQDFPGMQ